MVDYSRLLGHHTSELSDFSYDVILQINKAQPANLSPRKKWQFDRRALDCCPADAVPERTHPRALAYIIFTSGTSGQPKGVMVEHRSILRLVCDTNYIKLSEGDRILQTGSLAFDASTFEIWGTLLNGASLCLPAGEEFLDVNALGKLLRRHSITTIFLTTSLFNLLVDADITIFLGLKKLLTGGEKCSVHHFNKVHQACPDLLLQHVYGPTENTTFTTFYNVQNVSDRDIPIGRPVSNTTAYIVDDNLKPVPIGVPGELCTGGEGLSRGYLKDPGLTSQKFVPNPFAAGERVYRTGDLCRWLPDGNVEFISRRDNQVKVRGQRIELEEVESCLRQYEQVWEALVLVKDLDGGSLELVGYVTGDEALEIKDLRHYLAASLPGYMVPRYLTKLEKFPLNSNGKVDRNALPDPSATPLGDRTLHQAPQTETERQLAAIWEEVLGCRDIGVTDDFFAAGGHSLKVTKLISLIYKRMNIEMPLNSAFKATTIRDQANLLFDRPLWS